MRRSIRNHLFFALAVAALMSCQKQNQDSEKPTAAENNAESDVSTRSSGANSDIGPTATKVPSEPPAIFLDQNKRCHFDSQRFSFQGNALSQVTCLLRPVKPYGHIGEPLPSLPPPILEMVAGRPDFSRQQLRVYLSENNIKESDIGGSLDAPLSRANANDAEAPFAGYLVIHDTSTPLYEASEPFPSDINAPSWRHNNLNRWLTGTPKAHVFISRTGESVSPVSFQSPWRATKFESIQLGQLGKGLFLHVELVQPRQKDSREIDAFSPSPGFSEAQMERLALVYLAASLRRGQYLIPAYHAVLDTGFQNAHDDPQRFDISLWAASLEDLLKAIKN